MLLLLKLGRYKEEYYLFLSTEMGLFGKSAPPDPKEQVKEWSKKLRKERNALDRQLNQIKREEQKAVASIKQAA